MSVYLCVHYNVAQTCIHTFTQRAKCGGQRKSLTGDGIIFHVNVCLLRGTCRDGAINREMAALWSLGNLDLMKLHLPMNSILHTQRKRHTYTLYIQLTHAVNLRSRIIICARIQFLCYLLVRRNGTFCDEMWHLPASCAHVDVQAAGCLAACLKSASGCT